MLDVTRTRAGKIAQSNTLVRSRQSLDMMQRRLFYIAMEAVRRSDNEFRELILAEPFLRELMGADYGSFREKLREAASGLVGTTLNIHRKTGSWAAISIFQTIEYLHPNEESEAGFKNEGAYPVVRMKLHDDLKRYLIRLDKNFQTQDLIYVLTFNYTRAHKLFELLHHESWGGELSMVRFDREELANYLEMKGSYSKFRDYRRVIDRCREQIHEITPLRFTYRGVRVGRSIAQLEFTVSYAERPAIQGQLGKLDAPDNTIQEIQLANALQQIGYRQDPYALLKEYSAERVQEAINVTRAAVQSSQESGNSIRNAGGFLAYVLKNNIKLSVAEDDRSEQATIRDAVNQLKTEYDEAFHSFLDNAWDAMCESEHEAVHDLMRGTLNRFCLEELERVGWQGILYQGFRNGVMLNAGIVSLPNHMRSIEAFLEGRDHQLSETVRAQVVVRLTDELGLSNRR